MLTAELADWLVIHSYIVHAIISEWNETKAEFSESRDGEWTLNNENEQRRRPIVIWQELKPLFYSLSSGFDVALFGIKIKRSLAKPESV